MTEDELAEMRERLVLDATARVLEAIEAIEAPADDPTVAARRRVEQPMDLIRSSAAFRRRRG
jgi:hypothetical protein